MWEKGVMGPVSQMRQILNLVDPETLAKLTSDVAGEKLLGALEQRDEVSRDLELERKQVARLRAELEEAESDRDNVCSELQKARAEVDQWKKRADHWLGEVERLRAENDRLQEP